MTELERLRQAHDDLFQLANGIDPLTGQELPASDVIQRVQVSRCLFFTCDILRQVIAQGGLSQSKKGKKKKLPFSLSPEARAGLECSDPPTTIRHICQRLNDLIDPEQMQRMKVTSLTAFLTRSGLLYQQEVPNGKTQKLPTPAGRSLGLATETRTGQDGPYTVVTYNRTAQQLILDNLDSIIAINAEPLHENQGKPWTPEQDAQLQQLAAKNVDIKQLSDTFKRSRGAIRSRLEKLGIALTPASSMAEEEENLPF